jgi:hypothetical protein
LRTSRFFRYLWRVNAVTIFLAGAAITVAVGSLIVEESGIFRNRRADMGIAVNAVDPATHLSLERASMITGTGVMRAELSVDRAEPKFSSGGYREVRNILFIEPGEKAARWLLPDNNHIIAETSDIAEETDRYQKRNIATAVLVTSTANATGTSLGRLLLFDLPGRNVVEVANDVREIQLASHSGNDLTILYERNRRLVLAVFDPVTLSKRKELEIEIPVLK